MRRLLPSSFGAVVIAVTASCGSSAGTSVSPVATGGAGLVTGGRTSAGGTGGTVPTGTQPATAAGGTTRSSSGGGTSSGGSGGDGASGGASNGGASSGGASSSGAANTGGASGATNTGGASAGGSAGGGGSGFGILSQKRYGFTLDAVDDVATIVDSLSALPKRALVRVVFDYPEPPGSYTSAIAAIAVHADIVGQPSDSTYTKKMTVEQYRSRFEDYVSAFPQIELWEACNECNGDWAGENTPAQTDAAFDVIKAHGKLVLYTPYWNRPSCVDAHGDYLAWTEKNISSKVKAGTDLVAVSIYGVDCTGSEPAHGDLDAMFTRLAAMFPNARLGIGEYGASAAADKERVLRYYLDYSNPSTRYVFWGGYWYGRQDFVPSTNPLWKVFADAMR